MPPGDRNDLPSGILAWLPGGAKYEAEDRKILERWRAAESFSTAPTVRRRVLW